MAFSIGTKFNTRWKHPKLCTVVDVLRTYNAAGDLVRVRYVAEHQFMGQIITDHDVSGTAVSMGYVADGDPSLGGALKLDPAA